MNRIRTSLLFLPLACAVASSHVAGSCPEPGFAPQAVFGAGGTVEGIAVADFDGDGRLDLALAEISGEVGVPGAVAILLGRGDGTFGAPARFEAGLGTSRIVASDFDADGHPDVAALNGDVASVSILLGDGHGALGPQTAFPAGGAASGMSSGDFDGDGTDDLVVSDFSADRVVVLLGRGDGTFSAPAPFPAGRQPLFVATGDLDDDGKLDLVVGNLGEDALSVLLGDGDGTFRPRIAVPVPDAFGVRQIVVADLNGDGRPDAAAANQLDDVVFVSAGRGDGTFDPPEQVAVGGDPIFLAVADLDRDGVPDLAVADAADATISVLRGRGDLTFDPRTAFAVGARPLPIVAADLDRDGAVDLVTGNVLDGTISFLRNECSGNRPPTADAGRDQFFECAGNLRATATLDGSGSTDPDSTPGTDDDIVGFTWSEGGAPIASGRTATVAFGLGTHLVSLEVEDASGAVGVDSSHVTVLDSVAPTIDSIVALPTLPAVRQSAGIPVSVTVTASDGCDPAPRCAVAAITGRDPIPVLGDPGPAPSPAHLTVFLPASRAGSGRVFTIDVRCRDAWGNRTDGSTTVAVPSDPRRLAIPRNPS